MISLKMFKISIKKLIVDFSFLSFNKILKDPVIFNTKTKNNLNMQRNREFNTENHTVSYFNKFTRI